MKTLHMPLLRRFNFTLATWRFNSTSKHVQGYSDRSGLREYFYYIDHQGQLFLADTKIRNFVTCFKDVEFLVFFFTRLQVNRTGKYVQEFPYVSPCGREMNYVQCESKPIVFTDIIESNGASGLVINGIGRRMALPLQAEKLCMLPRNGRVYHPGPPKSGGVGILKTSLAIELSQYFLYEAGSRNVDPPTHFLWKGVSYKLDNELWELLKNDSSHEDLSSM